MSNDLLSFDKQNLRGTDSNSLLRLYDIAQDIVRKSPLQQDRARAEKAIQRIVKELEKRKVPFRGGLV